MSFFTEEDYFAAEILFGTALNEMMPSLSILSDEIHTCIEALVFTLNMFGGLFHGLFFSTHH